MNFMQFHLDIAYNECFADPRIIQSKRNEICDQISNLMVGQMPLRPSFEMLITARIKTTCPSLKKTKDQDLIANMYIHSSICNIIFEVINRRRMLSLTVKNMYPDEEYDLVHRNVTTVARGDEQSILKLKSTLEELVVDTLIRDIVKQYNELKNILEKDEQEAKLRQFVDDLLTVIKGGGLLGGFRSCELCLPGELSEVSI